MTIQTAGDKSVEILLTLDGKKVTQDSQSEASTAAAEEDIKPGDLPKSIRDALKARFPKAKITMLKKGTEEGKPIFEVSIKNEQRNIDVTLNPQGEILSFEKTLLPSDRPKRMMETLNAKYPHASIKIIEEIWEHDKRTGDQGSIITGKKTVEVAFDANGNLVESDKKN